MRLGGQCQLSHSLPSAGRPSEGPGILTSMSIERTEDQIVLEHAVLGRVALPTAQLKSPEPATRGLFGTPFLRGWNRSVEMGLSGASGNSQTKDLFVIRLIR